MSNLEIRMKENSKYFQRIWIRYVGDIFTIFDTQKYDIHAFLKETNRKSSAIKSTLEKGVNTPIEFFDTLLTRNNNRLEIDAYRKESCTNRFIMSDSNHGF